MSCRCPATLLVATVILSCVLFINHSLALEADDAPDEVEISTLTNLYEPVIFDHALHLDVADCSECHHHTTGQPPADESCLKCHANSEETDSISCSECHNAKRFYPQDLKQRNADVYHIDKPGLKGAYHLNCVGCHSANDGPVGCEDCHVLTARGENTFKVSIVPLTDNQAGKAHN